MYYPCIKYLVIEFIILFFTFQLVFLRYDRGIEFHVAYGKYYVIRVPRFGRDIKYHYPSCDLFVVGDRSGAHSSQHCNLYLRS